MYATADRRVDHRHHVRDHGGNGHCQHQPGHDATCSAGNAGNARTLANYLAGSLGEHRTSVHRDQTRSDRLPQSEPEHLVGLSEPGVLTETKIVQKEFNAFFKDDFKITRNLTLNLGVRWDYFGVPYLESGLTNRGIGGWRTRIRRLRHRLHGLDEAGHRGRT